MSKKVIMDMDTGVDDALAIMLALNSPELKVKAITVSGGNVELEQCALNTVRIAHFVKEKMRPDLVLPKVAKGLDPKEPRPDVTDAHGHDGLGGISKGLAFKDEQCVISNNSAACMVKSILAGCDNNNNSNNINKKDRDKFTIVTTGPMTNLSSWIDAFPELLVERVAEIICMGGAFFTFGNRSPVSEFNVLADPGAAANVLAFCRGDDFGGGFVCNKWPKAIKRDPGNPYSSVMPRIPLTFVGLDVTHKVALRQSVLQELKRVHPANEVLDTIIDLARVYMDFYYRNESHPGCPLHDPLAVSMAIDPTLCETQCFHVEIVSDNSKAKGMTIADRRPTRLFKQKEKETTFVCTDVDSERFEKFFLSRILGREYQIATEK